MNKYDIPYKASIKEIHHKEKLDSPSGTAISLADDIIEQNKSLKSWGENKISNNISMISKRKNKKIGLHSVFMNLIMIKSKFNTRHFQEIHSLLAQ